MVEWNEDVEFEHGALLIKIRIIMTYNHLNSAQGISHPVVDFMFRHLLNLESSLVCSVDVQM